eukprot:3363621-Amphidinium_carterae.1
MDAGGVFSATPPLEGLRVLASLCMTGDAALMLAMSSTCWTSAGHQHCDLTREVFIRLPKKDPRCEGDDTSDLLQEALNGVCDAAQAFE